MNIKKKKKKSDTSDRLNQKLTVSMPKSVIKTVHYNMQASIQALFKYLWDK